MRKILIAEDDLMIADMTEENLVGHGYDVCGIARTIDDVVRLARHHRPDLILMDFRLAGGGLGTEAAAQLSLVQGLGILYATGNASELMTSTAIGHACLAKPYRSEDLFRGLDLVVELVANRSVHPPFPRGFHLLQSKIDRSEGDGA